MKKVETDYKPQPEDAVAFLKETLDLIHEFGVYDNAYLVANHVYKQSSFKDEFDSYSKQLGIDPIEVVMANISYDLTMATMGCTTIVGETEGKHWIGRNMDWFSPELVKKTTHIKECKNSKSVAVMGQVGVVTGLSDKKFALILNALPGFFELTGKPVLLALREILENATSFEDAERMILETNFMASGLVTLVGENKDQLSVYELDFNENIRKIRAQKRQHFMEYPVVVTNNAGKDQNFCSRFLASKKDNPSFENVMDTLQSNSVKQDITAQTILIDFRNNSLEVFV